MIELYSGTPGSGKSLHMARDIYKLLNAGKKLVIANFDINRDLVKHPENFIFIDNYELSAEGLIEIACEWYKDRPVKEDSIYLFVDECQIIYNTRDWANVNRRPWLSFFSQHRKYGFHVVLVSQFDEMIDKQIRALIEYECIHRKTSNSGLFFLLIKTFTFGDWFICVNMWYPMKTKVSSDWFRLRKKYYSLYDTFNSFNSSFAISDYQDS